MARRRTSPGKAGRSGETPAPSRKRRRVRKRKPPPLLAAIDVGATAIRMAIAEAHEDGRIVPLEQLVHPISLGADTFRVGYVSPETLQAACRVLGNFMNVIETYRPAAVRAVGTSAIRDANNEDVLVDRIRHESGIALEVLDGVNETRITYQHLLPFLEAHVGGETTHTLVVDLGGGSTELMVLQGTNLVYGGTRRIGTSRLFHTISGSDCCDTQALLESVTRNIVYSTLDVCRAYPVTECVVLNELLLETLGREPEAEHLDPGVALPSSAVARVVREASNLPPEALARRFGIGMADAELLLPAAMILHRFLERTELERVLLVEIDFPSAILLDMRLRLDGEDPLARFSDQILRSALGLAEKFHSHRSHVKHVAELAGQLYDELEGFLDLGGKDRLYLTVAALLHDIGMFVSERAHHKHSAYLIEWSEIVGLSEEERHLLSLVARYHRKATPRPQHTEFAMLHTEDRLRVRKLAALLRLADALDRGHAGAVRRVRTVREARRLVLEAETESDLTVETAALREKGDLFEETTGLQVRLRRTTS